MSPTLRKLAVPGAIALGMGAAGTMMEIARDPVPELIAQDAAPATPASLSQAFRMASRQALPAVVHIRTEAVARPASFDGFFGGGRAVPRQGSGSGFIVSSDGYVVTNNHVVDGASRLLVVLNDGRELTGRVVGRDPNTDIAVIKVDARDLPTARIGDSDALETGDWVLALGYPLQLGQTTTAGIVSAKGRSLGIMRRDDEATAPLEHFIQTDAAINPGNSGGPLVDLQGRVVGVNSAIASPTGFYSGYGFAVPIGLAKRVADDLIRYGAVRRPMLGVEIRDASAADAEVFRLPSPAGAVIASEPRAGALEAGLRLGDVIVSVDGSPIRDTGDLMERVMRKQPGERVALEVIRYGERRRAEVRLGSMESPRVEGSPAAEVETGPADRLGFRAAPVHAETARRLGLPAGDGVVVTDVDPYGPAAGRLVRGFRIEKLNGREVRTARELVTAAEGVREGSVISLLGRTPDGRQTIVNYRARG